MNENSFIIKERLPSLNDYVNACRSNKYVGAKMKEDVEILIGYYILADKKLGLLKPTDKQVHIIFEWNEKTDKRDTDNIAFAKKFILDALQTQKIIINDNRKYVRGFEDLFYKTKENFIKVTLIEVENQ